MKAWSAAAGAAVSLALASALAGCNRNEAAQPARAHADAASPAMGGGADRYGGGSRSSYGGGDQYADAGGGRRTSRYDDRTSGDRDPVPMYHGHPMWSDNRRHTAQENAQYHFEHDGPDFGAKSLDQYLAKAHGFVEHPPAGVQSLTRRNGDKLLYDARSNTFAVERRDGAPRTMFKPRDGASYWREQQARANDEGSGGGYGGSNGSRNSGGYRGGGRGGDGE